MEDDKTKEEDMPAPAFVQENKETQETQETPQISEPQKFDKPESNEISGTQINNALERLESISNNFSQELSSLSDKFKEDNKFFLKDIEVFKDNLLNNYSQNNESNEKLSLKNPELDNDSRFRSLTDKPTKLINKMIELYTSLFDMVRINMKILTKFLQQGKDIDKKKSMQDFFEEEWLFMKIDFDKSDDELKCY